jgi:hypothetical protein
MFFSLFFKRKILFLKRKNVFLFLAVLAVFAACDTNDDPLVDALPIGNWVSSYNEVFHITTSALVNYENGVIDSDHKVYGGEIVNTRSDGHGAGYITIKLNYYEEYTYDTNPPYNITTTVHDNVTDNLYYVIHWKNFTTQSVEIAGAYSNTLYYNTQNEAETAQTVQNGCFSTHSACKRQ